MALAIAVVFYSFCLLADFGVNYWILHFPSSDTVVGSDINDNGGVVIDLVRIVYWIIPFVLWCKLSLSTTAAADRRWVKRRDIMAIICLPVLPLSAIALVRLTIAGFTGIPLLFVGVHLLALGYSGLISELKKAPSLAVVPTAPNELQGVPTHLVPPSEVPPKSRGSS